MIRQNKQNFVESTIDQVLHDFIENAIDDDNFLKLTTDLIKELLPKIGLRLHFLENWMSTYGQQEVGNKSVSITSMFYFFV